jgi:glyoxylase-like metal-dependent hydrolase (beta-lactamase superfamily II)
VDGKLAENYDELRQRVQKVVDQPIRVLVDTSYYVDHTGTNARFLADGTQVAAQENVKQNLLSYHPAEGNVAPPSQTYKQNQTLHFELVEMQLLHFGNARTNGDTVVYFPDLKAVAVGDIYLANPVPDYSAGGSMVGWSSVLSEILKLDFDVAIPGAGPTVSKTDLEALKSKIDALISRAGQLSKMGIPKDQLVARLKSEGFPWAPGFSGEQLDRFYSEISQPK